MRAREFVVAAEIRIEQLDHWVAEGWLLPTEPADEADYSEIDLARARFIRDMLGLGVNEDGLPIILDLVDQLHSARRLLRDLARGAAEPM
ncbi:MAG: MerR family transcriptional regulator [Hyphomicrobiales bacterium]|nr:MerR family transcriptional regulator [Hyphomicrobiales bacterium]